MNTKKLILAIETSCDETGIALVEASGGLAHPKFKVLKNLVASQIKIHRPFGGVVPNLAKREHLKNLPILLKRIMNKELRIKGRGRKFLNPKSSILNSIDLIAVTASGPGLEPALWAGINFAQQLYSSLTHAERTQKNAEKSLRKSASDLRKSAIKLVGASHLEGHLYSFLLPSKKTRRVDPKTALPAITLSVSGGHTFLIHMKTLKEWEKLGETRDDAVGEAFDKVARLLELPYPGGPELEKLATKGDANAVNFPRPMIHAKNFDFSFSGLKTSVLYYLRDNPEADKADIAASFQKAAIEVLVKKTTNAAKIYIGANKVKSIILCGGVAANKLLRKTLVAEAKKLRLQFFVPDFKYNTDNAAMIAAAAYFGVLRNKKYRLVAQGNPNI